MSLPIESDCGVEIVPGMGMRIGALAALLAAAGVRGAISQLSAQVAAGLARQVVAGVAVGDSGATVVGVEAGESRREPLRERGDVTRVPRQRTGSTSLAGPAGGAQRDRAGGRGADEGAVR